MKSDVIIRVRTEEREAEYTRYERYRIFVGTWNVNGQLTTEERQMREAFLAVDAEHPPDFYAIGFQELDLSKEAYLFDNYTREQFWLKLVAKCLHPRASYEMIRSDRLIGMMLVIFARKELVPFINNIEASHVGTGILGKMGNKGGVAIRFDLHETSLCFVNCHLAAHVELYERRNQDFKEIRNRLLFPQPFKAPRRIEDHHQIYWFGDLNYRVMDLTTEAIKGMLERGQFSAILEHDQLCRQKELGNCFEGYQEGPISHPPSYKYNPGTDEWDSSEKRRPPAWCDRILWRETASGPSADIVQLAYRSHPALKASDHKPVSALFRSSFRVTDQAAKRKVYEDVMKKLDKEENDYLPVVEIDSTEICFGVVRFKDAASRSLRVKNVGQSKIKYRFITKPNETSYCKEWLRITPASASIARNESIDIRLELSFEVPSTYARLNYGLETLSDTLVLSLLGGKDIFITVSGDYRPSAFGCLIETLISLKERPLADMTSPKELAQSGGGGSWLEDVQRALDPLKAASLGPNQKQQSKSAGIADAVDLLIDLSFDEPNSATTAQASSFARTSSSNIEQLLELANFDEKSSPKLQEARPQIFKELYILVDYIYKNGVVKRDLFQNSGSEMDFVRIREALDHSCPALLKGISVDSVAEALLLFLHSLPEPVIPYRFYERVVANRSNFSNCQQVIADLPESHRAVFEYLILFLKELLTYSAMNKLNATVVAKIFGSILLRKPESASHGPSVHEHYTTTTIPGSGTLRTSPGRAVPGNGGASFSMAAGGRSSFYVSFSSGVVGGSGFGATPSNNVVGTSASTTSLGSLGSSSSSSSSTSDLGGQVTLNPEQTFIYHFLCNSLD